MDANKNDKNDLRLINLFPELKMGERAAAANTLKRYLDLVWRIHKRISAPDQTLLTEQSKLANVKGRNT